MEAPLRGIEACACTGHERARKCPISASWEHAGRHFRAYSGLLQRKVCETWRVTTRSLDRRSRPASRAAAELARGRVLVCLPPHLSDCLLSRVGRPERHFFRAESRSQVARTPANTKSRRRVQRRRLSRRQQRNPRSRHHPPWPALSVADCLRSAKHPREKRSLRKQLPSRQTPTNKSLQTLPKRLSRPWETS